MNDNQPIRVLVVDDQALVRRSIAWLIETTDDMVVVGEASDGVEALENAAGTTVDVALMDIHMAGMDGIEATRQLRELGSSIRVLVLTTFDEDEYMFAALKAGASGFILKDSEPTFLLDSIRSVADDHYVLSPTGTKRLLAFMVPRLPDLSARLAGGGPLSSLTDREHEILAQLVGGATNAQIGQTIGLTETTIKTHVSHMLAKTGCRNRVELAMMAHHLRPQHDNAS
ncbi:MAG: response regulator transcription factor [Propionibacteriaceae bacterium]|jgi:DNA-binding NarL/FixJ family response regulator|nr:response regulator transcription factor [Propionibacteriaceae bacterium]